MSWDSHVNYLVSKLSRVVGLTYRHSQFLPVRVKLIIYHALVYSLLSYCNLVWGTATASNLNKIYLVQKKKIRRTIFNAPYDSHTENMFSNLQIIKIHKLSDYRLLLTIKNEIKKESVLLNEIVRLKK